MKARIFVRLKEDIADLAGQTVQQQLVEIGFSEVSQARLGKMIELDLQAADEAMAQSRVENMCKQLFANELIEEYEFELIS